MAVRVGHQHGDQSLFGRQLAVFSQAADVAAVDERPHGGAHPPCLGCQPLQQAPRLGLAKAPVAVGHQHSLGLADWRQVGTGHDLSLGQRFQIKGDAHHAVGIVAPQVGSHQAGRNQRGFFRSQPAGGKQAGGECFKFCMANVGHGASSNSANTVFVLCYSAFFGAFWRWAACICVAGGVCQRGELRAVGAWPIRPPDRTDRTDEVSAGPSAGAHGSAAGQRAARGGRQPEGARDQRRGRGSFAQERVMLAGGRAAGRKKGAFRGISSGWRVTVG